MLEVVILFEEPLKAPLIDTLSLIVPVRAIIPVSKPSVNVKVLGIRSLVLLEKLTFIVSSPTLALS